MAAVKCEFCGNYISDTQEKCPTCGAPNKNFKRMVDGTPKTIEDLKSWYIARKLPPEEVTRFFIGKDIKEPRAFGIYEDNGQYIVYKNKSNGERAIRYKGRDESYAVNELYLKLKEEILNQKNINSRKRSSSYNSDRYLQSKNKYKRRRRKNTILSAFLIGMILFFTSQAIITIGLGLLLGMSSSTDDYFLSESGEIYFYEGYCSNHDGYSWWKYDDKNEEWEFLESYKKDKQYPEGVTKENNYYSIYSLSDKIDIDIDKVDIRNSRAYIDDGHHLNPDMSYYYYNDNLYYFIDDTHSSYGNSNNTGWYVYEDNDWEFYCSDDDKDKIGEDLWYNGEDYSVGDNIGDVYDYVGDYASTWNPTDFSDTSWYESYESNEAAYDRHLEETRNDSSSNDNSWDNDSDWDWDSGSDWDSGGIDWDSDW